MEDTTELLVEADAVLAPDESLLCPITHVLMRDPVILTSGHAVELGALVKFWRTTCPFALVNPVTREPMRSPEDLSLVPGLQVRAAIDAHLSRLASSAKPDGWPTRSPGCRSTRDDLRALSAGMHQICASASTIRISGRLPPQASPAAAACLGLYDRDASLVNDRPSYTSRDGSHAIWYSAAKADGIANGFWHAAEVEFKGMASGRLGAHAPSALVVESVGGGRWQAAGQPPTDEVASSSSAELTAAGGEWVSAPGVRCDAEGSADAEALASLLARSARAILLSGRLPSSAPDRDFYKAACLGVFDRDDALTHDRPSYTRRGGSHALWYEPDRRSWLLGAAAHRASGAGWMHALAPDAWTAEAIGGPWSLALLPPAADVGDDEVPPLVELEVDGVVQRNDGEYTYIEVPLRCDGLSVELIGSLPDAMLASGSDPHDVASYLGVYDLYERSPVHGKPAYVQRGTQATRALWFAQSGCWHCGSYESIGMSAGPVCAQEDARGPERLRDPAGWQVNDGTGWIKALTLRCRAL